MNKRNYDNQPPGAFTENDELANAFLKTDENMETDDELTIRRRSPFSKAIALICLLAFLGLALPNLKILFQGVPSFLKQAGDLSQQELVKQSTPAVVKIDAVVIESMLKTTRRSGTGFNISSEGLIVTNKHVVEQARELTVTFPDGSFRTTNNVSVLPGVDMALIVLNSKGLPFLQPDLYTLPAAGEMLTIIGNPNGYENIPVEGILTGYVSMPDSSQPVMLIDASIGPGNSGSPVLNKRGKVVGVIFASRSLNGTSDTQALAFPLKGQDTYLNSAK